MSKPRVLLYVLTGRERDTWVNGALFRQLLQLQDDRYSVTVDIAYDLKPYEHARNWCVMNAKLSRYDYVVQVDNDVVLPANFRDVLHETITSGKAVVGLKYGALEDGGSIRMFSCHDNMPWEGNFRRTGIVGAGVLILSAEVWRTIPTGPWFRWECEGEWSSRKRSEDVFFAELAQEHGLEVWTHKQAAGHLKTADLTAIARAQGLER